MQEGIPAQIHRRVTLVRSDEVIREKHDVSIGAQLPSSSTPASEKPKIVITAESAAAVAGQQQQQQLLQLKEPNAAELSLNDIVVKQVTSYLYCETDFFAPT